MARTLTEDEPGYLWVARVLWGDEIPELGKDQNVAENAIDGFLDIVLSAVTILGTASAINGAAIEPTVRKVQQAANALTPNALPSPSDLVRFELREVFREEDRAVLMQPPPTDTFRRLMQRHGFNSYHADSYWAAHWVLPSLEKGFEMLHRLRPGRVPVPLVFSADDMRKLLKTQDVLPRYHEQLMAISYAPLTRVDVRRMFKLGVLSKVQVAEAYKDLGYDDTNAGFLADFTEADIRAEERELTRGDWIASFREDLATEAQLREALVGMGYATDSVDRIVALELQRKEMKLQREQLALDRRLQAIGRRVRRASRAGTLDDEGARQELEELGVDDVSIARFFATYKVPALPKPKDLTRGEELAAFRYGVTTEAELRERLGAQGLDGNEVDRIVKTEKAKMRKPDAKGKELSKSDVLQLYKKGVLSPEEAIDRLIRVGYKDVDAEALVIGATPAA